MLVLSLLKQLTLQLILLDHKLLFNLLDLVLVPPLRILKPLLCMFPLICHLTRSPSLNLLDLLLQSIVLHLEHLFNPCVLTEN